MAIYTILQHSTKWYNFHLHENIGVRTKMDIHNVHVSSRKSKISEKERPLLDTAGDKYSFLDIQQKVEMSVLKQGAKGKIQQSASLVSSIRKRLHQQALLIK
jgi:hypothetical protein